MVAPNGAAAISRGVDPVDQITPHRKKPQRGAGDGSDRCLRTFVAPRHDIKSIPAPRHGANRLRTFVADSQRPLGFTSAILRGSLIPDARRRGRRRSCYRNFGFQDDRMPHFRELPARHGIPAPALGFLPWIELPLAGTNGAANIEIIEDPA